jgi:integrase/recombinase XerD
MPTPMPSSVALVSARDLDVDPFAQAQIAAGAYLARYSGRTLETYRYVLRTFFQWCTDVGLDVLEAQRAHIELWRSAMEERGPAASTIDRRLSTICGFYRFAHIDGRISSNPAQYARRSKVYPSKGPASTGASSAGSSSRPSATTPTMPPWPPCWARTDFG